MLKCSEWRCLGKYKTITIKNEIKELKKIKSNKVQGIFLYIGRQLKHSVIRHPQIEHQSSRVFLIYQPQIEWTSYFPVMTASDSCFCYALLK